MQPVEKSQNFAELLAETVAKLQSQVLMLLPGLETGLKIQAVLHLGNGGKKKSPGKFFAFFDTAFNGTNGSRTGPGMAVMLTFVFTQKADLLPKKSGPSGPDNETPGSDNHR